MLAHFYDQQPWVVSPAFGIVGEMLIFFIKLFSTGHNTLVKWFWAAFLLRLSFFDTTSRLCTYGAQSSGPNFSPAPDRSDRLAVFYITPSPCSAQLKTSCKYAPTLYCVNMIVKMTLVDLWCCQLRSSVSIFLCHLPLILETWRACALAICSLLLEVDN